MEQIRKQSRSSRRCKLDLSPQIHQSRPIELHRSRSTSTHTDNTCPESIFSTSVVSGSALTSHGSLTPNNPREDTWSPYYTSKDIKEIRYTSNKSRRREEISISDENGMISTTSRSLLHTWKFAGGKSCNKKVAVYHYQDEQHSGRQLAHPVYTGVYPHESARQSSLEVRGNKISPSSVPHYTHEDSDVLPVLTYAQKRPGCGTGVSHDGIQRAKEWLLDQDYKESPGLLDEFDVASWIVPIKDHVDNMRPKGFAEEGLTCLHGSITDYLAEKRDEVFPSSLGSEPCSESSHESTSTDLTEENTKDPSMASSTCKKDLQMALPYRPRYNEPTEVTALAGLATQPSKETPPTSNGAYSQPNHIASSRQCDNNDHTGTKKRKTRQSRSKDQPEDSDNIDEDNNDDRRNNRRQGSKGYKGKEVALGLLACPYFKYDSIKYAGEHWRRCCGPGWKDVHRMKEHLYKHHRQPRFLCTRCGLNFQDEVQLRDHTREIKPCVLQQLEPADGFDSKQEERLKSRKRTVTQLPEDEKWKQTYKILFPHIPEELIPSPFYDYVSPNSDVLVGYGEYAHREIQGSFRSVLEREIEVNLGLTEPNSKQKVVDLIEMVNSTLLKNFSNSRGRGSVTPTALHSASTSVVPEISETRLSPVFLTPLSAEQLLLDDGNSALLSNNTTAFADDFGFDFGFYTDGRDLQVMVEPSSNGGSSKPSDSAYGSMSIKDSECSRDSGQHEC